MAMTAWAAKVWRRAICVSEKRPGWARMTMITPMGLPSRSSGTPSELRQPPARAMR